MTGRAGNIGPRLHALRTGRNLTLEQLSGMAGVSKAMLSQIEQDKANPTVAVVIKIASALHVSPVELIDLPEDKKILRIIPAGDEKYTYLSDTSCTIRTLSPLSLEKSIEFYRLSLKPGGELHSEAHFPGTQEFLHVAAGRLEVRCGEQATRVGKGDSVHYRADAPHVIKNIGKGKAELYMIVHYRPERG